MNKPTILYVDDESVNLELFEANLEDKYTVLTADNAITGLDIISKHNNLKVVISDMKMPQMNGIEFIKKATLISPKAIFYILTGFDITDEIKRALDTELIQKYFRKPFNMNEISSEISRVLNDEKE
ncbi:MAG: response regulator [Salinivirgaceae bacterium]|jgi:two-component system response regulator (stage 0 sporulation protein F)|nr:response regulator [Salinivirgaceae bacterium]